MRLTSYIEQLHFAFGLTCVYIVPRDFLCLKIGPSTNSNLFSLIAKISVEVHNQNWQKALEVKNMNGVCMTNVNEVGNALKSWYSLVIIWSSRGAINAKAALATPRPLKGPAVLRTCGLFWCSCYGRNNHWLHFTRSYVVCVLLSNKPRYAIHNKLCNFFCCNYQRQSQALTLLTSIKSKPTDNFKVQPVHIINSIDSRNTSTTTEKNIKNLKLA